MAQPDFVFRGHQAAVNGVRFFADDRFLVSGDQDGHLIVWNMLLKRRFASAPKAHSGPILAVCGVGVDTVVSQGRDNKLCVWRLEAGEFKGELVLARSMDVDAMSFCKFTVSSADGETWIVALSDAGLGDAFAYEVGSGKHASFNIGHKTSTPSGSRQDPPMSLSLECLPSSASDGDKRRLVLYAGYESTLLQCFELCVSADGCVAEHARFLTTQHKEPIMSIDFDSERQVLYTCAADNTVCCIPVDDADASSTTKHATLKNAGAAEIRCFSSPDLVAVAGWDYVARLYSKDLEHLSDMVFHRAALTSIDLSTPSKECPPHIEDPAARQRWSSRPQWLAVASRDTRISLWVT
ncbi:Astra associated protein 1 Asa1 [Coemansia sp. RSA 2399]|nr:Astra associated protein 1 Asa1 [Coemansia sp. RSA 2399]KAJ1901194.1 Astra associated protein 1 Asa1 [Coemansia sp. IMI 209127]